MAKKKDTASFKITQTPDGNIYHFFCDVSEALVYQTNALKEADSEKELMLAWEEAKQQFNHCHKCGRWIIDAMYNPDVLTCVECTPIEETTAFCSRCGTKTAKNAVFCHKCGSKLLYGSKNDEN